MLKIINTKIQNILENIEIYQNNKKQRDSITYHITNQLNINIINNDIMWFKVICNEENNIYNNIAEPININVYLQIKTHFHLDVLQYNIKIDKLIALRKLRIEKIIKLNERV